MPRVISSELDFKEVATFLEVPIVEGGFVYRRYILKHTLYNNGSHEYLGNLQK